MPYIRTLLLALLLTVTALLSAQQDDVLDFQLPTRWSEQVSQTTPWNVYPRPQMRRDGWTNLNGKWDYAITPMTQSSAPANYAGKILVPYPVESALSGVKKLVSEEEYLWYRRSFTAPRMAEGERLLLHFGAVDFSATVYLNGKVVGGHQGGYTAFSFDVTPYLNRRGSQELVVRVSDPTDTGLQARGKQVQEPEGIYYTPVTGIWQTTWLEVVPENHITSLKVTPDVDEGTVNVTVQTAPLTRDLQATVTLTDTDGGEISKTVDLIAGTTGSSLSIELPDARLWSPEDPHLYPLSVSIATPGGSTIDEVDSYAGMRKVSLGKDANGHTAILLNNAPYFQFGPLDQGWWPDGLYTAPTPEAMRYDIEMTKRWGFNMLRKHVKVEPATFYHACDSMGVLVWQDMPNGYRRDSNYVAPEDPRDADQPYAAKVQFEREYRELIDQFHFFPSIVVWVPFNEGWGQYDTERIADWTRAYDPTRLVNAPSGWTDRGVGDMYDVHIYPGPGMEAPEADRASVLGEYGGLGLPVADHLWWNKRNWGYQSYQNVEELNTAFRKLTEALIGMRSKGLSAAIYTQTTDVEGEVNGLMTYDREVVKIDTAATPALFSPLYERPDRYVTVVPTSEHEVQLWRKTTSSAELVTEGTVADAANWEWATGSFSTFTDYYHPGATPWNAEETLYLQRTFHLSELPDHLYAKFVTHRADFDVYLNGKRIMRQAGGWGGRGHYTIKRIDDALSQLKTGANTLTLRVKGAKEHDEHTFDLGLFGTVE